MKRPYSDTQGGDGEEGGSAGAGLPVIVKLLAPIERAGSVIGKGGEVIKSIRAETGARVKVEDNVPGQKERAVTISSPDRIGSPACGTQDALARCIERVYEIEMEDGGRPIPPETVEVKIIVDRGFVGHIVGKQGTSINQIKSETECLVQIIPPHPSPLVAAEEQIIKVSGVYNGVKKACHMIIDRVREALQKGTLPAALQPGGSGSAPPPPGQRPGAPPPSYGGPPPPYGAPPPAAPPPSFQVETTYKILMPDSRVGALIGKGGEHLKRIRSSTNSDIHVENKFPNCPDRLVVCKSTEAVDSNFCGAAEALMKCASHTLHDKAPPPNSDPTAAKPPDVPDQGPGSGNNTKSVRLVAPGKQMGAVIGLKGATIRQLSADTRAKLSVIRPPIQDVPPELCSGSEEVLQIEGTPQAILAAVRIVTMLLRGIMVRQQAESKGIPPPGSGPPPQGAPPPYYPPGRGPPPPGPPQAYGSAPPPGAPPPYGAPAPAYNAVPPPGRPAEDFHRVAPPSSRQMHHHASESELRYNPRPHHEHHTGGPGSAPAGGAPRYEHHTYRDVQDANTSAPSGGASGSGSQGRYGSAPAPPAPATVGGYAPGYGPQPTQQQAQPAAQAPTTVAYGSNYGTPAAAPGGYAQVLTAPTAAAPAAQYVTAQYGQPAAAAQYGGYQVQAQPQYGQPAAQATGQYGQPAVQQQQQQQQAQPYYAAYGQQTGATTQASAYSTNPAEAAAGIAAQLYGAAYAAPAGYGAQQAGQAQGQQQQPIMLVFSQGGQLSTTGTTTAGQQQYGAAQQQQQYSTAQQQQYGAAQQQQQYSTTQQQQYGTQQQQYGAAGTGAAAPAGPPAAAAQVRYTMRLQPAQARVLMGANGEHIDRVRQRSGAVVKLSDTPVPGSNEREVEMAGTQAQATAAYTLITSLVTTGAMPN